MHDIFFVSHPAFTFEIKLLGFSQKQVEAVRHHAALNITSSPCHDFQSGEIAVQPISDPSLENRLANMQGGDIDLQLDPNGGHRIRCVGGEVYWSAGETGRVFIRSLPHLTECFHFAFELAVLRLLASQGTLSVHAALVEYAHTRALLVGPSGSGKSTLAMVLLRAGGTVVTDDLVVASIVGNSLRIAGMRADIILRYPTLAVLTKEQRNELNRIRVDGEAKYRLHRSERQSSLLFDGLEVVFFLDGFIASPLTKMGKLSLSEAYARLLAQTSALFLSDQCRSTQTALLPVALHLLQEVENRTLLLGRDLLDPDACVDAIHTLFSPC